MPRGIEMVLLANIVAQSCSETTAVMAAAVTKQIAEATELRCSDAGAALAVRQTHVTSQV